MHPIERLPSYLPSSAHPGFDEVPLSPAAPLSPAEREARALLASALPTAHYQEIDLTLDRQRTLWCVMRPNGPPSYTHALLRELLDMQCAIKRLFSQHAPDGQPPIRHFVAASRLPGIFNLGGDLLFFADCIRRGDREALTAYAHACIEVIYNNATAQGLPVVTIALVQGDALGGGFESVLSCEVIIAERSAKFGLPEVLFKLFPGMGAYNLLARRLDAVRAERMILSGRIYSASELHEMGLIDVLAEDGLGEQAVRDYIARNLRQYDVHRSLLEVRRRVNPLKFEELSAVTQVWVDAALRLQESELRKMERLMAAQMRRVNRLRSAAE